MGIRGGIPRRARDCWFQKHCRNEVLSDTRLNNLDRLRSSKFLQKPTLFAGDLKFDAITFSNLDPWKFIFRGPNRKWSGQTWQTEMTSSQLPKVNPVTRGQELKLNLIVHEVHKGPKSIQNVLSQQEAKGIAGDN